MKYRIVVDQNMPGIDFLFGDFAEIIRINGREIDNEILKDADALLCRSITQVNKELLSHSAVKFVGTATIGTDHLDIDWLESQNISWANAAGCNAAAVAQYVLSAMAYWSRTEKLDFSKLKVGIVGAGNVGTELARCFERLGIQYLLYDPPLESQGDKRPMVSFEEILKCDVITLHVPIVNNGTYPTKHMIGRSQLRQLNNHQLLINASRGAVIDNSALIEILSGSQAVNVVLDVFETEPDVPLQLLKQCLLTTPHIAGHTLEGKLRGSWLIYKAFCNCFRLVLNKNEADLYPDSNQITLTNHVLADNLLAIYDIQSDSEALRLGNGERIVDKFDRLRKNATQLANGQIRRDYSGWEFVGEHLLPF